MPYITKTEKQSLGGDDEWAPQTVGQLTYLLTRSALRFKGNGRLKFVTIALVMGAFFCAALEFYRRVAIPYENAKMAENGDVFND